MKKFYEQSPSGGCLFLVKLLIKNICKILFLYLFQNIKRGRGLLYTTKGDIELHHRKHQGSDGPQLSKSHLAFESEEKQLNKTLESFSLFKRYYWVF